MHVTEHKPVNENDKAAAEDRLPDDELLGQVRILY